jgi:hypothetical protein
MQRFEESATAQLSATNICEEIDKIVHGAIDDPNSQANVDEFSIL